MYSCHLFLISSASVKVFAVSVLYIAHTCMKYSLDISGFLEEISNLSHSIVFLCIVHLRLSLSLLAILWNSAFSWVYLSLSPLPLASLLFSAICKESSDKHFAFLNFFFLGMVLVTTSCTMLGTSVHSSSVFVR